MRVLLLAAVMAVTLVVPAGAATIGVPKSDLPTQSKVAKLYPHLGGGARYTSRSSGLFVIDTDCASDRLYRAKGWYAAYDPKRSTAITAAKPYVYVHVWEFRTVRRAKAALAAVRDLPARCPQVDLPTGVTEVTAYAVPPVGEEGAGYRMHTPSDHGWATIGMARAGARIVQVGVVSSRGGFGKDRPVRKLVKAAAARAF